MAVEGNSRSVYHFRPDGVFFVTKSDLSPAQRGTWRAQGGRLFAKLPGFNEFHSILVDQDYRDYLTEVIGE